MLDNAKVHAKCLTIEHESIGRTNPRMLFVYIILGFWLLMDWGGDSIPGAHEMHRVVHA
jgi:hypothetical protein